VRPEVRVVIVGKAPPAEVRALASERIEVTGEVPSVLPYLHRATLTVLPLRSGGGTRLKVLEAMASGTPVLSTAIGVEGLDLRHQVEAWIGDRPRDLAEGVLALLADPSRAAAMALTARRRVERDYAWSAIGADLVSVFERGRTAVT
jgi:polysaccharide biosynthesis protein PslH